MKKFALLWPALLFSFNLLLLHTPVRAATTQPQLFADVKLPNSERIKYPDVAALNANVFIAGNREDDEAVAWRKTTDATTIGNPAVLGDARGLDDAATTSVAVSNDGAIYYAWTSFADGAVYMRRQLPGGTLETPKLLGSRGAGNAADAEIIVDDNGTVILFWREINQPMKYRVSRDRGSTWSGVATIGEQSIWPGINAAKGPNNQLAVTYATSTLLQIYVAFWNGSTFDIKRVTRNEDAYANPSLTINNEGLAIVAWRGTDSDGNSSGVFFSEQQANGTFTPLVRLFKGGINSVSISSDESGNLHLFFIRDNTDIFYGFRPSGESWNINNQLQRIKTKGAFNLNAATSRADSLYSHLAYEDWSGSTNVGKVLGFRLPSPPSVRIQLEGDAPTTDEPQVDVGFLDVGGSPDQLRYNWGSAPTDANPWQGFNASGLSVAVPSGLDGAVCNTLTLFVQTRNTSSGQIQQLPATASIVLDTAVQASVNLNSTSGLAGYTRVPTATVVIDAPGECSDLDQVTVDESGPTPPQNFNIDARSFSTPVSLSSAQGKKELLVTLSDALGNSAAYTRTIVYDSIAPTLVSTGTIELTSTTDVNTIVTIAISGTQVNDGGSGVAGILLKNSNEEASAAAAVFVPFSAFLPQTGTVTLTTTLEWSVLSGLPRSAWEPGTYNVDIQFADAAGNPTGAVLRRTITISDPLVFPTQYLPAVRR